MQTFIIQFGPMRMLQRPSSWTHLVCVAIFERVVASMFPVLHQVSLYRFGGAVYGFVQRYVICKCIYLIICLYMCVCICKYIIIFEQKI